jgi:hypothetical protein
MESGKMKTSILVCTILMALPAIGFAQITWTEHLLDGSFNGARGLNVVDLDSDGDLDIIGCAEIGDEVAWWENLGGNEFSVKHIIASSANGAENVSAADLDGDGDIDVTVALLNANKVVWYENDGSQNFILHVIDDYMQSAIDVHAVDLDADGLVDVLAAGAVSDDIIFHRALGGGEFTPVLIEGNYDEVRRVRTGDMDGDGDLDIVSCAALDAFSVSWWESQAGATVFVHHSIDTGLSGAYSVDVQDMDSDGDLDIVSTAVTADDVVWYENDASGLFAAHTVDSNFNGATDAIAVDMDFDGMMDIVAVSWFEMRWYQRISDYGFNEMLVNPTFQGGRNVLASDLNGDGYMDIVSTENLVDNVTWWEHNGPPPPSVNVLNPNGGELWYTNTTHVISWNSNTPGTPVKIELLASGVVERTIASSEDNDGSFQWVIPGDVPIQNEYQIHITLIDSSAEDVSDSYFSITASPSLTVTPVAPPIIIPPQGYGYWYFIEIVNTNVTPVSGQYWAEVILPDGSTFGPLYVEDVTIDGNGTFFTGFPYSQWVPPYAPPGVYEHVVKAGMYPTITALTDSFYFEKLAGGAQDFRPLHDWEVTDWQAAQPEDQGEIVSQSGETLPAEYQLHQIYPNPFNGSATVSVSLPVAGNLTVEVYNTTGQRVATLHDGSINAGTHSLSFDASHLASGLYFVQAISASGELNEVQKVMLVR